MNTRITINLLGRTILCEAALLLVPLVIALCHGESVQGFAVATGIAAVTGCACVLVKPRSKVMYAKEGFVVCALSWIILSLIGAVPFVIDKWIPNYIDAVFEIVSGFTTTGATLLQDFTQKGAYGLFFWRSLSHWIGGMGVLVFILAIMPMSGEHCINLMRAEVPGPSVGKLVPRIKDTAMILYAIYVGLTVIEFILLLCGGMSVYEALIHAFGTAGTGGFSNRAGSIGEYSPYIQYVIAIFMFIFAVNFNLYYFILIGQWKESVKNEELHWFLGVVVATTAIIAFDIRTLYASAGDTIRNAVFQVATTISSTGYATFDIASMPVMTQTVTMILMIVGACAGSTGGGMKLSRVIILFKSFTAEIRHMLHPNEVVKVRMDKKPIPNDMIHSTLVFFGMYMACIAVSMLVVAMDGFNIATTSSAVISCVGNMGPGLWQGSNFMQFSWLSKIVLSFDMLLGRLEILPILVLFSPSVWKYRKRVEK